MTTTRNPALAPFPMTFAGRIYVDTVAACPACSQLITVTLNGAGTHADYSECGGAGEGGCEPWIDGDTFATDVHSAALLAVTGLIQDRLHGMTSCRCEILADRVLQPVGDCPWHGDVLSATEQAFGPEVDGEEWVHPM